MKLLIRRVQHSQESELKKSERYTTNRFYSPEKQISVVLYSIPDVVETKCKCGCDGVAMDETMKVLCEKCIDKLLGKCTKQEEHVLVVPFIEQAVKGNAFEWQPQGKETWYKIKGMNIVALSNMSLPKEEIKNRFDEIMSKVLNDDPQLVDADYDKDNKKLILFV